MVKYDASISCDYWTIANKPYSISLWNHWHLHCSTISILSLILSSLVTKSHLRVKFPMLPSPDFTPDLVPVFKSPQEVTQQSFQRPTFIMLYTLLAQGELKMQSRSKSSQGCCHPPIYINKLKWPEESWDEGCSWARFTPHHRRRG